LIPVVYFTSKFPGKHFPEYKNYLSMNFMEINERKKGNGKEVDALT